MENLWMKLSNLIRNVLDRKILITYVLYDDSMGLIDSETSLGD